MRCPTAPLPPKCALSDPVLCPHTHTHTHTQESDYATLKDELTASPQLRLLCPRVAALLVDPAHSEPTL